MRAFSHICKALNTMKSQFRESTIFLFYLDLDEDVDYRSDTNLHGDERTLSLTAVPVATTHTALKPFAERDEANAPSAHH